MARFRSGLSVLLATAVLALLATGGSSMLADAAVAVDCSTLDTPVHQVINPKTRSNFLTTSAAEADDKSGYTQDHGTPFEAALSAGNGLLPVHRMYRSDTHDYLFTLSPTEVVSAQTFYPFVDQGISFYASATRSDCLVPVYRYLFKGQHRLVSAEDRAALDDAGWLNEGIKFYAGSSGSTLPSETTDTKFSFAVLPDTQQEVLKTTDARFRHRSNWLVQNRSELDLRFVTHSGDVIGWDTPDHVQYEIAQAALRPLETANIPFSLAVGNHDTAAVCVGGSACDPTRTKILVRDTSTFNDYFTAEQFGGVDGVFEPGKLDNAYALYQAGGVEWMVLTLELWPRTTAINWAKTVVADHPDANVLVVTHSYLDSSGGISQRSEYGQNSPQYLFDNLIKQYANIKMVFSGHVGSTANRVDTGVKGNKIYSFLQAIHSNTTNPVRLVEIDTRAKTLKTWVYAPYTNQTWADAARQISGVDLVR